MHTIPESRPVQAVRRLSDPLTAVRRGAVLLLLLLAALPAWAQDPATPQPSPPDAERVKDQYIVVFKPHVQNATALAHAVSDAQSGTVRFTYEHALKGFSATLAPKAVEALRKNPNVAYIEPNRLVHLFEDQPSPPSWGLDRTDQTNLPLDDTYSYHADGTGVTVFILDTGIWTAHSDFGGRATIGFDAHGDDGQDCNGHGTHVAGTVGSMLHGVAKNVSLVAVKVFPDCAHSTSSDAIFAGIDYVTGQKLSNPTVPMVANMSLGSPGPGLEGAVSASIAAGVTYVVSAGNSNIDACNFTPARTPEAVTVGATTITDARASYSNYGSCLDLFAPGSDITSTWLDGFTMTMSGTSMAAPHVAGVAALYLERFPNATPAEVSEAITGNATPGVVSGPRAGSPNLLLYSGFIGALNSPPIADAGDDQTVLVGDDVTLDGTGSSDPDGDDLTFAWTDADGTEIATGETPTVTLPLGTHTITLTVTDPDGETDTDEVVITIEDTTPPVLTVGADSRRLWPPNHEYHSIALDALELAVSDQADPGLSSDDVVLSRVWSDEPENSPDDGNTLEDIRLGPDCRSVELRAERDETGNGRVYTLELAVSDAAGNTATAEYQVYVPVEKKDTAQDDGAASGYTVEGTCPAASVQVSAGNAAPLLEATALTEAAPEQFALEGNYPNPFNPSTEIGFALPEAAHVRLVVYDMLGREVARLAEGPMAAGQHRVRFEASHLPSGTYLYRIEAGAFSQTRRMVLLK